MFIASQFIRKYNIYYVHRLHYRKDNTVCGKCLHCRINFKLLGRIAVLRIYVDVAYCYWVLTE